MPSKSQNVFRKFILEVHVSEVSPGIMRVEED